MEKDYNSLTRTLTELDLRNQKYTHPLDERLAAIREFEDEVSTNALNIVHNCFFVKEFSRDPSPQIDEKVRKIGQRNIAPYAQLTPAEIVQKFAEEVLGRPFGMDDELPENSVGKISYLMCTLYSVECSLGSRRISTWSDRGAGKKVRTLNELLELMIPFVPAGREKA